MNPRKTPPTRGLVAVVIHALFGTWKFEARDLPLLLRLLGASLILVALIRQLLGNLLVGQ